MPGRSTLLNILSASPTLIEPLIESFRIDLLASEIIGTDNTSVTLLLPPEIQEAMASAAGAFVSGSKLRMSMI